MRAIIKTAVWYWEHLDNSISSLVLITKEEESKIDKELIRELYPSVSFSVEDTETNDKNSVFVLSIDDFMKSFFKPSKSVITMFENMIKLRTEEKETSDDHGDIFTDVCNLIS